MSLASSLHALKGVGTYHTECYADYPGLSAAMPGCRDTELPGKDLSSEIQPPPVQPISAALEDGAADEAPYSLVSESDHTPGTDYVHFHEFPDLRARCWNAAASGAR